MAIKIHCIRHAQGLHNIGPENNHLVDPALTPLGIQQCELLAAHLPELGIKPDKISLIAASPMTRTIHTAYLVFQPLFRSQGHAAAGKRILAVPDVQETSSFPCDIGSSPTALQPLCEENSWPVDLTLVYEGWTNKTSGRYIPTLTAINSRARDARWFLRQQAATLQAQGSGEDVEIAVISHGGFLQYFTADWEDAFLGIGTGWANTELRTYTFQDQQGNHEEAWFSETIESRSRRGKTGTMAPAGGKQQDKWFEETMRRWEMNGMQTGVSVEREMREREMEILRSEESGEVAGLGNKDGKMLQPTTSLDEEVSQARSARAIKVGA